MIDFFVNKTKALRTLIIDIVRIRFVFFKGFYDITTHRLYDYVILFILVSQFCWSLLMSLESFITTLGLINV